MDLNSFLTSLGTYCLIFLILVLLYSWMSRLPVNAVVYYPNLMNKKSKLPKGTGTTSLELDPTKYGSGSGCCNPFGWIGDAVNSSEEDIINILEKQRKNLAQAETIYEESKTKGKKSPSSSEVAKRPTHKLGFLGLCGREVDSIEHYTNKVKELESKHEEERTKTLKDKQLNAALVFFTNRVSAALAAQSLHDKLVDEWTVTEAPEPSQLLWNNLRMKFFERQLRKYVVYFIVALTILFYMIPIGVVSAFTTLKNLMKLLPFLKLVLKMRIVRTVLEAYLPQLVLIVFMSVLPMLLLFLSKAEGVASVSHAERGAAGKFFYFTVLNVFIGVTLGGTLFNTIKEIQQEPNSIVEILASSIPQNAAFFISYVALK
uniref:CSC1-like protein ERD4 n=1 Tax=Cannabis sativa TaxID=3483 RepID=A0A803QEF6_CANSA